MELAGVSRRPPDPMAEGVLDRQVVPLIPKLQPFEDAILAFVLGRNPECIAALHHHRTFEAAILRTRAYMRLGQLDEAEKSIRSCDPRPGRLDDLAQSYMLLGAILDRQGDAEGARDAFVDARGCAFSLPSLDLHSELAYHEAACAWRGSEYETAEKIAYDALAKTACGYDRPSLYPIEISRAMLLELLALTEGLRENHDLQISLLKVALQTACSLPDRHVWIEGGLLNNLASLVPEIRMTGVAAVIREHAESLPWTDAMRGWAYNVYRALGWSEALEGKELAAFRDLRDAEAVAPSIPRRMEAILDRAFLFGAIGETISARERFDEADRLCKCVDWSATQGEDRYVLLWGAELAASFDAERAGMMIQKYRSIQKPMDSSLVASAQHRRWQAYEHDAYGSVAAAKGDRRSARAHFREALRIWDSLNFEWRAAKTAANLARVSRSVAEIGAAKRRASEFPNSWLATSA